MCIGNNVMPKCESLHTLSSLPYHILEIQNNDDHYHTQNNKMLLDYRGFLEHLRNKVGWPGSGCLPALRPRDLLREAGEKDRNGTAPKTSTLSR